MSETQDQGAAVPALDPQQQEPAGGGSYLRRPDGTLQRVAGTRPAPSQSATLPGDRKKAQTEE